MPTGAKESRFALAWERVDGHRRAMRSMTGFGRGLHISEGARVVVEIRAVNRKQAEVSLRLPVELESLEIRLREEALKVVARGRVEIRVDLELPPSAAAVRLNRPLAAAYAQELQDLARNLNLTGGVSIEALLRCPGVLQAGAGAGDPEEFWGRVEPAFRAALQEFNGMREREGEALAQDLTERVAALQAATQRIKEQAPLVGRRYREQLGQRLKLAGIENISVDDERVLKEIVLFADRSDISEELARLGSHFAQFEDCRRAREPVGRKLDFLAQEINREVNTIGSKANDALIATDVVALKTELERFREQAQNVE